MSQIELVVDGRTTLAQSWCALKVLHDRIDTALERELQAGHDISVREFALLEVLSRQHDGEGGHLQMKQIADAIALSQSATTRLVARLEGRAFLERYICPTDRRGIYTNVTPAGRALLSEAHPTNAAALDAILEELSTDPSLASLVALLRADHQMERPA